jgi:type IV pilus assembly protein PilX
MTQNQFRLLGASPACPATRPAQQGVTLLVVLVMLAVIGLTSASAMRQAANADMVSNNTRLEQLAKQSAQAALHYCESQVTGSGTPAVEVQAANAGSPVWKNLANWKGSGMKAVSVPTASYAAANGVAPQCLVEYSPLGNNVYIITARGFSPDFKEDTKGKTQRGAVVWLQSTLSQS